MKHKKDKQKFFSIEEAADYLGVSKATMYSYAKTGIIPAFKPLGSSSKGGSWRIPVAQLEKLAAGKSLTPIKEESKMKQQVIVTNTGVYDVQLYDKDHTVPEYGVAYILREDYGDDDLFYLYRGKIKRSSIEPGIYVDGDGFHEFVKPIGEEKKDYLIKTHLASMEPGDMMVVLRNKKNIEHVYNESSKLYIPEITKKDNILKRAIKSAFKEKNVSIDEVKDGFSDRNSFFNFSSVLRSEDGNMSFLLMDRGAQAMRLGYAIIFFELDPDNPVGKPLNNPEVMKEINKIPFDNQNPIVKKDKNGKPSIDVKDMIVVSSEDSFDVA